MPLYLWSGRGRWFFGDEWTYLTSVDGGDLDGLLTPDNEHWTTLPRISYRVLFNLFGINTYVPYQLVTIAMHLIAASLLRVVMRRSGVSPWMATVVAGVFVLLGSGDHNILRAFQVTFGAALAFGLTQLVLADHDGPIDRRDVLGLLAGLAALMCSGIGIAMVAAVAVAMLIGRGWRAALFHLAPLAAVYAVWWWRFASERNTSNDAGLGDVGSFAFASVSATFDALGQLPSVGLLIAGLLVVGLVLAWSPFTPEVRRRNAAPSGLLFGAFVFIGSTAWSRADLGTDFASQSRYVHIIAALVLPALAVGADMVARRWPLIAPALVALLLIGVPGNLSTTWNQTGLGRGDRVDRALFLAFASVPEAGAAPDWVRPDPQSARTLTMGWLRKGVARGQVPRPSDIDPALAEEATFRIALQPVRRPTSHASCGRITEPIERYLEPGELIGFLGSVLVRKTDPEFSRRIDVPLVGQRGSALLAVGEPLDITIVPREPTTRLCEP